MAFNPILSDKTIAYAYGSPLHRMIDSLTLTVMVDHIMNTAIIIITVLKQQTVTVPGGVVEDLGKHWERTCFH